MQACTRSMFSISTRILISTGYTKNDEFGLVE